MADIRMSDAGGNWDTGATWDGGTKPGLNDKAVFDASSGPATLDANQTIGELEMTGYTDTLTLADATELSVDASGSGNGNVTLDGIIVIADGQSSTISIVDDGGTLKPLQTDSANLPGTKLTISVEDTSVINHDNNNVVANFLLHIQTGSVLSGGWHGTSSNKQITELRN